MMFKIGYFGIIMIALSQLPFHSADNQIQTTIVNAPLGPIKGFKTINKQTQLPLNEFRGIKYAKPPVGPLRFKKPLPVDPWTGILDATEFGAACPQEVPDILSDFKPKTMSEDCLFLNVYVPGDVDPGKQLPVMVWIHGGGLSIGFSHQYDGGLIATEGNVIVVSINYRLGVFGFFAANNEEAKGNYGLWDQKLALEWVSKNIGTFGGNPESVTIFGESAGGWSSSLQSLIPSNQGLFQRVICQSGVVGRTIFLTKNQIAAVNKDLSDKTSCQMDDMNAFVRCLKEKSMDELLNVNNFFAEKPKDKLKFQLKYLPVVDGELYKDHPIRQLDDKSSDVSKFFGSLDFIAGHTSNEGLLFATSITPEFHKYYDFNSTEGIPIRVILNGMIYPYLVEFFNNDPVVKQKFTDFYTVSDSKDEQSVKALDFSNSVWFTYHTAEMLRYHSTLKSGGKTYQYQLSKNKNLNMFGEPPSWAKGCGHGSDLQYMFDLEVLFPSMNETDRDLDVKELSASILKYWTQFAWSGQPDDWAGAVPWKQFDFRNEKYYLDLDTPITLKSDLDPINTDFWRNQIPQIELEQPEAISTRDEL